MLASTSHRPVTATHIKKLQNENEADAAHLVQSDTEDDSDEANEAGHLRQ